MRISDWSSDVCSSITTTSSAGRFAWRTSRAITEVVGAGAVPPWRRRRCGSGGVAGGPVLQHEVQAGDDRHDGGAGQVGVDPRLDQQDRQIGRASCRERGCQYVLISVVAGKIKK